jgi:hypothetical protein
MSTARELFGYPLDDWAAYAVEDASLEMLVLQNVVAHPAELTTLRELGWMLDETPIDRIVACLDRLTDAGIVAALPGEGIRFYGLTHEGKQFLCDLKLLRMQAQWREIYLRLRRPPSVLRAQRLPRPVHPPAYEYYPEQTTTIRRNLDAWTAAFAAAD